ncbi:MAG: hypothetical protein DHS20C15_07570 [Planctomycetota bacterium]|nr:MAG: hypothetical protein DHS20C15_07570 [Planctomycetota bacterium]
MIWRLLALPFALALLAGPSSAQRPLLRFELHDGERVEGAVEALDVDGFLIDTSTGRRRLPGQLVRLVRAAVPRSERPAVRDLVVLAGSAPGRPSGRLWGRLSGGDDAGLRIELPGGPLLGVPFDVIDRVLPKLHRPQDRLLALADGGFDDRVWRLAPDGRLDALTGVLAEVDGRGLMLESSLGDLRFDYDEILAVVLAATEAPDASALDAAPLRGRLRLTDGSLFPVGVLDGDREQLRLLTAFAGEQRFDWSRLDELLLPDPALANGVLADTQPTAVEESSPAMPEEPVLFPWQRDLSVGGAPAALDGVLRASALGVHADARLSFAIPPAAQAFRVSVGVADEARALAAEASVEFHLEIDGEVVASSGRMRWGDGERVLRIDSLGDARELSLICDDAGDLDAADRALFANPLFLSGG